jgi:manganese/zinc/iron transport system ATP- binding protein
MSQPTAVPALEFHDFTVAYDAKPVLYGVDCQIPSGSLVGILGPNGAGKSTLLRAALGLMPVSKGYAQFYGQPFSKVRQKIGYVPQRESVDWDFPVTVQDVVRMGRYGGKKFWQRLSKEDLRLADEALEKVQLTAYADRQISQLSGGQQQRVFLARALAQQSDMYLMDEPFAAVDAATERTIVHLLREMQQQGRTVLVVHHDLTTAPLYFDHLLMLNLRLVAFGKTEETWTPDNLKSTYGGQATMLSEMAFRKTTPP